MKKSIIFISLLPLILGSSVAANNIFIPFGTVTVAPSFRLNGSGTNIDSLAFWEAPNTTDTLMFVTGKDNYTIEIWKYPFVNNELPPLTFSTEPNGVDVDQDRNWLLVADAGRRVLKVFSLPDLKLIKTIGEGKIGKGETNLDVLNHSNGQKWVYITDDHKVHIFNLDSNEYLGSFSPNVYTIEELVADHYYQIIYVPDEQGSSSKVNPTGGIYAHTPDGKPFRKGGKDYFGYQDIFSKDEEGILIYTCPSNGVGDDGRGFIVISDQSRKDSGYEFFDRQSWEHLGTLNIKGASYTDGIASTQKALPDYPLGLFAVVNDDTDVAVVGWDVILKATGLNCAETASPAASAANLRVLK